MRRSRGELKRLSCSRGPQTPVGPASAEAGYTADLQLIRKDAREAFRRQRIALGAMIAAAPLLGLLGTVSGMVKTFESLSAKAADKSMEGLARGISEVLVATESGLLVALPALLFVWLAHREVTRHVEQLNQLERSRAEGRPGSESATATGSSRPRTSTWCRWSTASWYW